MQMVRDSLAIISLIGTLALSAAMFIGYTVASLLQGDSLQIILLRVVTWQMTYALLGVAFLLIAAQAIIDAASGLLPKPHKVIGTVTFVFSILMLFQAFTGSFTTGPQQELRQLEQQAAELSPLGMIMCAAVFNDPCMPQGG